MWSATAAFIREAEYTHRERKVTVEPSPAEVHGVVPWRLALSHPWWAERGCCHRSEVTGLYHCGIM